MVIEEVQEPEYFKDKRIQVTIFMSPLNVHINYYPISGTTSYYKYHPGKYLVAWHPKSSTENERSTVVVTHPQHGEVLFRQIAGALARRICTYAVKAKPAQQGQEFGFIKFGSRVDLLLPLDAKVEVSTRPSGDGFQIPSSLVSIRKSMKNHLKSVLIAIIVCWHLALVIGKFWTSRATDRGTEPVAAVAVTGPFEGMPHAFRWLLP